MQPSMLPLLKSVDNNVEGPMIALKKKDLLAKVSGNTPNSNLKF